MRMFFKELVEISYNWSYLLGKIQKMDRDGAQKHL